MKRNHSAEDCKVNEMVHDTPPEVDCGHDVMEGPGLDENGDVRPVPDGGLVRKDSAAGGPGVE